MSCMFAILKSTGFQSGRYDPQKGNGTIKSDKNSKAFNKNKEISTLSSSTVRIYICHNLTRTRYWKPGDIVESPVGQSENFPLRLSNLASQPFFSHPYFLSRQGNKEQNGNLKE
ncbi:hypothetical protein CEXT_168091 [Caerostris extrusa]|uniref:Ycf1 n=1 Tax=Caerostris extrusa TaxID=172846 RepID=A0AAV4N368_CAEEX|nr:hypothetical protein CEXT_168091 [Caerostris extrusa]